MNEQKISSAPDHQLGEDAAATYSELARFGAAILKEQGRSKGQVANYLTALTAWRRHSRRASDALLSVDFRDAFDGFFRHFQDCESEAVSRRTLKDRCEQVLWWRKVAAQVGGHDMLPPAFPAALAAALKKSGLTKAALCREASIAPPTLDTWLLGKRLPVRASANRVESVERALELAPGTLAKRLPPRRKARFVRGEDAADEKPMTSYSRRVRRNLGALRDDKLQIRIQPTPRLRKQWLALLEFKTDDNRPGSSPRTWRTRQAHETGMRTYWYSTIAGCSCPTAGVHYGMVTSYLGFLKLPEQHGGLCLDVPTDSLAWLARADLVIDYVKWVRRRADNINHNGLQTILQNFMSHVRPDTGFVWLRHELARDLPEASAVSREQWRLQCAQAHQELRDFGKSLKKKGKPTKSRNPRELFSDFMASEFPMMELVRMVQAVEADPPPTSQKREYATWIRDVLLLNMLCEHPLRANHYATMTFRGPSPNLVRTSTGWMVNFDAATFKNHASGAVLNYFVPCDIALSKWIDRYLAESRPLMIGANDCNHLFLPSRVGNRSGTHALDNGAWTAGGMYSRVKSLSSMYTPSGLGLSPHTFRHVPVSDHLARNPGDYITAARYLNDKLETVLKEYDHNELEVGMRKLQGTLRLARQKLQDGSRELPHRDKDGKP